MKIFEPIAFTEVSKRFKTVIFFDEESNCDYLLVKDGFLKFNNKTNRNYNWTWDKIGKKEVEIFEGMMHIYTSMDFGNTVQVRLAQ